MAIVASKPDVRDRAAWTYASGLASALEGRLLPRSATVDLLSAASLAELLGRVRQTLLFDGLPDTAEPFTLANQMDELFAAALRRVRRASPSPAVADAFLLEFEWRAFRCYLRSQVTDREPVAVAGSETPEAVWERCWNTADVDPGLWSYAQAARRIRAMLQRERQHDRLVDEVTEAYKARHAMHVVGRVGSPAVTAWVTTWVKLRLGLDLLRCSLNNWPHIRIADALDDFGVAKHEIMGLATPERPDWRTPFRHLGLPAAETIAETEARPAAVLERLIDDRMTELARGGRRVAFGPEPVAAFLWGLRVEWRNLKLIVAGVAAGLPREAIAEDIRQSYV